MNKKVPRCKLGLKKLQLQTQSYNEWTTLTLQRTGYWKCVLLIWLFIVYL